MDQNKQFAILIKDEISFSKEKYCYGKKGQKVEIIKEMGNVSIVELDQKRFPVKALDLKLL
ncbi:MAG TPA: hypothetical protein VIH28_08320 [Ignavibacteriaceae bacterium]